MKLGINWFRQPMKCGTHGTHSCPCTGTIGPWISRLVFADLRVAPVWLLLRLWLGWQWLEAGWEKMITNPAWMQSGVAVKGILGASRCCTRNREGASGL